jgi:hypothetical protein
MRTTFAVGSARTSPRIPVPKAAVIVAPAVTRRKLLRVMIFSSMVLKLLSISSILSSSGEQRAL